MSQVTIVRKLNTRSSVLERLPFAAFGGGALFPISWLAPGPETVHSSPNFSFFILFFSNRRGVSEACNRRARSNDGGHRAPVALPPYLRFLRMCRENYMVWDGNALLIVDRRRKWRQCRFVERNHEPFLNKSSSCKKIIVYYFAFDKSLNCEKKYWISLIKQTR